MRTKSRPLEPLSLVIVLALAGAAAAQGAFEKAKARYDQCIVRLPFRFHTEGREGLARTGEPAALEILLRDYRKPQAYEEHARYTIASLLGKHFDRKQHAAAIDELREAHAEPEHAWLWVQALAIRSRYQGPELATQTALGAKSPMLRAAAILALSQARDSDALLPAIREMAQALPKKEGEQRAVIAAMSTALLATTRRRTDPLFVEAVRAYTMMLETKNALSPANELMIARHLGALLGSGAQWVDPEPWLEMLEHPTAPKPKTVSTTSARPRFFGLESDGERICYVIDLSDSMLKKIDPSIKPEGTVTGVRPKRKPGALPDETDIPWGIVNTRFDLAREHLKISLNRLAKDKHFSVIWFGTEAGALESCNGMIPATRGNIARVIKELDEMKSGPATADAPDGVLKGRTNLHGGLRHAFAMKAKGAVPEYDYVDAKVLAEGADTIFLLSDGAPSWDDFGKTDRDYGEDRVVRDTEYGVGTPRTPQIVYHGPYNFDHWILDDIRRLNAFRCVQIYCVGIGEARMELLKKIAELTMGQSYVFGAGDGGK
jgi:hypothetical protein